MELQSIAEESAKAAGASQQAAAAEAEAETHQRKVCIACGKRSESEDSDTAMLVAFATKRVLRREDLISVIHVSELPPLVLCVRTLRNCAQRKRKSHANVRGISGRAADASVRPGGAPDAARGGGSTLRRVAPVLSPSGGACATSAGLFSDTAASASAAASTSSLPASRAAGFATATAGRAAGGTAGVAPGMRPAAASRA